MLRQQARATLRRYRDAGPTDPVLVVDAFAAITFVEDCGRDDETVIACAPADLPDGYRLHAEAQLTAPAGRVQTISPRAAAAAARIAAMLPA